MSWKVMTDALGKTILCLWMIKSHCSSNALDKCAGNSRLVTAFTGKCSTGPVLTSFSEFAPIGWFLSLE